LDPELNRGVEYSEPLGDIIVESAGSAGSADDPRNKPREAPKDDGALSPLLECHLHDPAQKTI